MPRVDSYCHTYGYYKNEPVPSKSREQVRKTFERAKANAIEVGDVFPVQQLWLRLTGALWRHIDAKDSEAIGAQMQADLNFAAMVWQAEFSEWWEEFAGDESHLHPQTNPPPRVEVPILKVLVNKPGGCVVAETKPAHKSCTNHFRCNQGTEPDQCDHPCAHEDELEMERWAF